MKITSISLLLIALLSLSVSAQSNWYAQNSGVNRELTGVYFVDENTGWICGWTGTILHTTNGGQTWNPQTCPPTNAYYSIFFTDSQNGWATGYHGKIVHTSNGGETWELQPTPTTSDIYSVYFINSNEGWAAGGDYGSFPSYIKHRVILHTSNGGYSWAVQYYQSNKSILKSICFVNNNDGYSTGGSGVLMRTTDAGVNWSEGVIGGGDFNDIFFVNESLGFASGPVVYKTTNGGDNWSVVLSEGNPIYSSVYFTDELNGWTVGEDINSNNGIIYHSTDGGENWLQENTPTFDALFGVFFANNNSGWTVGHLGTVAATENSTPVELTSFTVGVNDNNVLLSWQTSTETNNAGFEIQRKIAGPLPGVEQNEWVNIGFVEGHGTTTNENNYSFTDKNLEPGNYSYKLVQKDFDGTHTESKIVNVKVVSNPVEYVLSQNYPNPFNPTTKIKYTIPKAGEVTLKVYNAIGQEVASIVNNFKEAGTYSVDFNAASFVSGVYLYKLTAGNYSQVRKMILLK